MLSPAVTAATGLALAAAAITHGVVSDQSQLFGPALVAPPLPAQLALTFDDGPNPAATPQLLELLARHNVGATFFLIGQYALREPALTRAIAAAGHTIGNHTMTHPWLPRHSSAFILDELTACNRALEDTLGQPVTLFRPPHGARSPAVFRAARTLNLQLVQWNLIVGDWKPITAATIHARIARGIARHQARNQGTSVVLHDGGQSSLNQPRLPTVQAVAQLLSSLPSGTTFVNPPDWSRNPSHQ